MIRAWEEKDLPKIAELERECFSDPWNEQALFSSFTLPFSHCFLIEDKGQVCGYCILSVLFEDAEVLNIAVSKEYRKKGYGGLLMENMLERARALGATQCFLEVRESNAAAIALYTKYGFLQYGIRKNYYEDGENALTMKKIF
ncbi:MAG: ribosomal protein S18-alanine N-acetyltransferase [Clostridia bacterium]|nr:ribosomal protein S18-alanine N-acetyltransferase [Clostridia bacterium]